MTASRLSVLALAACTHAAAPAAPVPHAFHVDVSGQGPAVILVPGLSSSGETWTTTVAHLREHHTCHVLTLAGFAGVPPVEGALRTTVETELASYITSHHLGKPVIIGHSLGGELALDFAAEHPELAGPLVIVDSLPFLGANLPGVDSEAAAKPIVEQMRGMFAAMTQDQYTAAVKGGAMTRAMVTGDADHQRIIGWGLASDRSTVASAMLDLMGTDLRPKLARIEAPALVIGTWVGWKTSPGAPTERGAYVERFHEQYAGLRRMHFVMTDTARHFVMFDDLPWFLRQLDGFLADPDAAVRERGV